jgi:hypothetical protein
MKAYAFNLNYVDVYSLHYNTERCIRQVQCGILTGNSIHDRLIFVSSFGTDSRLEKEFMRKIVALVLVVVLVLMAVSLNVGAVQTMRATEATRLKPL